MTLPPRWRKLWLSIHIVVSVGWIGAVAAYLPLDVTTVASDDAQTLRAAYLAMGWITTWALVPLALLALATGLVVSLGTPWGLFRHWWVLLSLLLTVVATLVLLSEARVIGASAAVAADPTTSAEDLRALPSTLPHSIGGAVVLLVVAVLNVYKPRGLTPYGLEKEREERARGAR